MEVLITTRTVTDYKFTAPDVLDRGKTKFLVPRITYSIVEYFRIHE